MSLSSDDERLALRYARAVIAERLGGPAAITPDSPAFYQLIPNFVTLYDGARLQGCIGNLEPREALSRSLAHNALAAAFDDPRNQELSLAQVAALTVELSLLSPREPLRFSSEDEARALLRPHVDGALLTFGRHRGVFLPQVWRSLPEPRAFLDQLKVKAGLAKSFWDDRVAIERFTVRECHDGPAPPP